MWCVCVCVVCPMCRGERVYHIQVILGDESIKRDLNVMFMVETLAGGGVIPQTTDGTSVLPLEFISPVGWKQGPLQPFSFLLPATSLPHPAPITLYSHFLSTPSHFPSSIILPPSPPSTSLPPPFPPLSSPITHLISIVGANRRQTRLGSPWIFGRRVVSLATQALPDGLSATRAATIMRSCLSWGSLSTTTELTESRSILAGRTPPMLVMA